MNVVDGITQNYLYKIITTTNAGLGGTYVYFNILDAPSSPTTLTKLAKFNSIVGGKIKILVGATSADGHPTDVTVNIYQGNTLVSKKTDRIPGSTSSAVAQTINLTAFAPYDIECLVSNEYCMIKYIYLQGYIIDNPNKFFNVLEV